MLHPRHHQQDRPERDGLQRLLCGRRLRRGHHRRLRHPQLRLRREPSRRHTHLPHRQKFPRPLRGEALRRKRSRPDRRQHHEPQDRGLSGRELHHADGDDPDPGHRLHQAGDGLLLRGRQRGGGHRASADPRRAGGGERHAHRAERPRRQRARDLPLRGAG